MSFGGALKASSSPSHPYEQVPAESQCHGFRRLRDEVASLGQVDGVEVSLGDLFGADAESSCEPE